MGGRSGEKGGGFGGSTRARGRKPCLSSARKGRGAGLWGGALLQGSSERLHQPNGCQHMERPWRALGSVPKGGSQQAHLHRNAKLVTGGAPACLEGHHQGGGAVFHNLLKVIERQRRPACTQQGGLCCNLLEPVGSARHANERICARMPKKRAPFEFAGATPHARSPLVPPQHVQRRRRCCPP